MIDDIMIALAVDFWVRGAWIWASDDVRQAARTLMMVRR